MGNDYQVFISFASEDEAAARCVYDYLSGQGLRVFFSPRSLGETHKYVSAIDDALDSASCLVLVASSVEAVGKAWVKAEWQYFVNEVRSGRKEHAFLVVYAADDSLQFESLSGALRNEAQFVPVGPASLQALSTIVSDAARLPQAAADPPSATAIRETLAPPTAPLGRPFEVVDVSAGGPRSGLSRGPFVCG